MRVAVIGVGRMGRRHVQVVRELSLELVGVCDTNPESLALAHKEQNVPAALGFTSVETMIEKARPECVIVATTTPTHCEYTCAAVGAGARFVLCEKPMGTSLADCDKMLSCCASRGARLAINHQMRFMEQYTIPKRIVQSPEFGGLSSVTVTAGNFGMAMNGSHYFEMFRFMTDEQPAEVTAWFSKEKVPNPRGPQFEDRAGSVRIVTASGKRFYLDCSSDQGHGVRVLYAGRFGQIYVDELAGAMSVAMRESQYRELPTTRYGMPAVETAQKITPADAVAPSRAVLEALLADKNPPSGADGRLAVAVLVAAYLSNENGNRAVAVDGALPVSRVFPWA